MLLARSALVVLLLALPLAAAHSQAPGGPLTIVVNHFGKEVLDRGHTGTQDLQYNGHPYEALIGTARNGELTADRGLAESWRMSPDARAMTVRLRKNVRWHDGKPFTADDVVFSFMNRETYAEYPFYPIAARNTTFAVGPRVADWSPGDNGVAWHLETVKACR